MSVLVAFDILPMSDITGENRILVALAVRTDDGKLRTWQGVTRRRFLDLIHQFRPKYIGTDNPYEVLEPDEELWRFCSRLPPVSSLVHVNSDHRGNTVRLGSLIKKFGIRGWERRSPLKTAIAMIRLIEKGVGVELEVFEPETIVKVGQPRRHSKGGWSQARYARQNEEVVASITRRIEEVLRSNRVEYDLVERSTKYGAKSARFHTFVSRLEIGRLFAGVSLKPARIEVISPPKATVSRRYIRRELNPVIEGVPSFRQRLIVGIDPGTTVGIAIMSLDGDVISLISQRQFSKGEIVQTISDYGVPVIFCADVTPIPQLVHKLAATFDAELISPQRLLTKLDKRELAKKAGVVPKNTHESDALAAVIRGYQEVKPRFKNLDTGGLSRREVDLARGLILKGLNSVDARTAVLNMRGERRVQRVERVEEQTPDQRLVNRISNLLTMLAESEFVISELRSRLSRMETEVERERRRERRWLHELQRSRDKMIREALSKEMVERKSRELRTLREELKRARAREKKMERTIKSLQEALWIGLQEGNYPMKVLKIFSRRAIDEMYRQRLSEGDLVLVIDGSGGGPKTAMALVERQPRAIFFLRKRFSPDAMEVFETFDIPVLDASDYDIKLLDTVAIITPLSFEKAMSDYETLRAYRTRLKNKEEILNVFRNYQIERRKVFEAPNYDDYEPDEEELDDE